MSFRGYRSWARCGACRTRRATGTQLFQHLLAHPECKPCTCGGYHHPHRKGSRFCDTNPTAPAWRASRAGCSDAEFEQILAQCLEWAAT